MAALGALVRGSAGARARAKAERHLAGCARCRHLRTELVDVNRSLRTVVGPMILGGAAAAYLGTRSAGSSSAPVAGRTGRTGRLAGRQGLVAGALVGVAAVLLVLGTDLDRRTETESPGRDVTSAAPRGAGVASSGRTAPVAVLGTGSTVRAVATRACADALGVGLTSADGGPSEANGVLRAVLVPTGTAGLPTPTADGVALPVSGDLAAVLRRLVADPCEPGTAPRALAAPDTACVHVSPTALLAADGGWTLLVAHLPSGRGALDDLRFAVLGRPLALLGSTARAGLAAARATLVDTLAAVDALAAVTAGGAAGDLIDGDPVGADPGDLLAPLAGDPATGGFGSGTSPTPPAVTVPPVPSVTVPPVTVPALPGVTLPSIPLPSVPLPGVPLGCSVGLIVGLGAAVGEQLLA